MKYQSLSVNFIAMISLIGLAYFVVITIAMHKLRPDYNPRCRYISEYAIGKYGQLATSSFVIYGLAILGIYLCLQISLPARAKSNMGLTLIVIWGVAKIITGFFKVDIKDKQMSFHGTVHSIASCVGAVASTIGSIYLSFNFAHDERTQSIVFTTQMFAIVATIILIFLFLGLLGDLVLKYHRNVPSILFFLHNQTGIAERLLLSISVVWLMIITNCITT